MTKPISILPLVMLLWNFIPVNNAKVNFEKPDMVVSMQCKLDVVAIYDVAAAGVIIKASDLYVSPATTTCTTPNNSIKYFVTAGFLRNENQVNVPLNEAFTTNCVYLTAIDACNDSVRCKITVTILDTIPPVITCPTLKDTVYCNESDLPAPYDFNSFKAAGGTFSDNTFTVLGPPSGFFTVLPVLSKVVGCQKIIERRYAIRDYSFNNPLIFNSDTCSQFFKVSDRAAFTCPKDSTVKTNLNLCTGTYVPKLVTGANCDVDFISHNGPVSNTYNIGTTQVTFTAATKCKDTTKCTFTVTVVDRQAPIITCPANVTLTNVCNAPAAFTTLTAFTTGGGTATDNCGNIYISQTVTSTSSATATNCPKVTTRTYVVSDINGNSSSCVQTISVNDVTKPTITPPQNITVGTSSNACTANVMLTNPTISDNCTPTASLVLTRVPSGNIFNPGTTSVIWTVTDGCNNSSSAASTVTVIDNVVPNIVCKGPRSFNLSNGPNTLNADSLLLSAVDNCPGVTTKLVRRMTTTCSPTANVFGPNTTFCCADKDATIQVVVQVTDANNNSATCMVNVLVKDKLPPRIEEYLRDITVSCDYKIELTNLKDFGTYVLKQADRKVINLIDPLFATLPGVFKDGLAEDNCAITVSELTPLDQRQHNRGDIIRRFVVTDASGNTTTANQKITIVDVDPFVLADITWPLNYTYSDCKLMPPPPSVAGSPTFRNDDVCSLPAATFKDQIFDDPTSGCIYIRRTWKVIDWAQYVSNGTTGIWTHVQDIHLINNVKPVIKPASCVNKTICATNSNCDVKVALGVDATDDCTELADLIYDYQIDYNNDGTIDVTDKGDTLNYTMNRGVHLITWRVEDRCGNRETCSFTVTAKECKAPTPVCLYGLSTNLENDATVSIWAKDFNNHSYDNCTKESDLKISFSSNVNDVNKILTCANRGTYNVSMWVTDLDGNQSKCNTFITVTDNKNLCPAQTTDNTISIAGRVTTEEQAMMKEIQVNLVSDAISKEVMTDNEGSYLLSALDPNKNYEVKPFNNKDWSNGVSTVDLVMIQRHLLGVAKLNSPYKMIAADANNDEKISAADLVSLRKLILGQITEISNNTSYRFVDKGFVFADPKNPWPFNEVAKYDVLNANMMNTDFYAIKVGDVNGTVSGNLKAGAIKSRTNQTIDLSIEDKSLEDGKHVNVPILSTSELNINALQLMVNLDKNMLDFVGVMAEDIMIEENDYHYNTLTGELRIINVNKRAQSLKEGRALFTLQFKAKGSGKLSAALEVKSIASFVLNSSDLQEEIALRFSDNSEPLLVNQNVPNPFEDFTDVKFKLAEDSKVEMTIYDGSGMTIYNNVASYKSGENQIRIDRQQLGSKTGVFFLHIATGEKREIKKLLRLN